MGRCNKRVVELDPNKLWKKNLNGKYWVSEYGDVVNATTGYKLQLRAYESGYVRVGKAVTRGCAQHTAVYEAFVGEIPLGMQINHLDGVKTNNHISNLELCTASQNIKHAFDTGLKEPLRGDMSPNSILTEEDVIAMYGMFKLGYSNEKVGEVFNIKDKHVSLIRHGSRWTYLFEREGMYRTRSLGRLKYPLPKCVWIYNMCMSSGVAQDELANILGIDSSQVSRIRTGKTWKYFREFFGLPESTEDWRESGNNYVINQ